MFIISMAFFIKNYIKILFINRTIRKCFFSLEGE